MKLVAYPLAVVIYAWYKWVELTTPIYRLIVAALFFWEWAPTIVYWYERITNRYQNIIFATYKWKETEIIIPREYLVWFAITMKPNMRVFNQFLNDYISTFEQFEAPGRTKFSDYELLVFYNDDHQLLIRGDEKDILFPTTHTELQDGLLTPLGQEVDEIITYNGQQWMVQDIEYNHLPVFQTHLTW